MPGENPFVTKIAPSNTPRIWRVAYRKMTGPIKRRWSRISGTNQRWIAAGILCFLVFVAFQSLSNLGAFQIYELNVYDQWVKLRPKDSNPVTPILIIGIDDQDLWKIGQSQISDLKLASLIGTLEDQDALAVGVDLVRDMEVKESDPSTLPKNGPTLQDVTTGDPRYDNVVFVMKQPGSNVSTAKLPSVAFPPPKGIDPAGDRAGAGDTQEDADGIVRRGLLCETVQLSESGQLKPIPVLSFPMAVAQIALNPTRDPNGVVLRSGSDTSGPFLKFKNATLRPLGADEPLYVHGDTGGFQMLLDYREADDIDGAKPIKLVHYRDVLASNFDPEDVRGKIVLIGKISQADKDFFSSPLQRDDFGIRLHARLVNQILRYAANGGQGLRGLGTVTGGLWLLAWCLLGGILGNQLLKPWDFGIALLLGLAAVPLLSFAMFLRGTWIPTVGPALAFFTATTFVTAAVAYMERETIRLLQKIANMFGGLNNLSKGDIDEVIRTGRIKPRDVNVTVLFTDLKDFSDICKTVGDPKPLMEWLNTYMDTMTRTIDNRRGCVNKYMGDAIMAIFGAPIPSTNPVPTDPKERARGDARNAVRCALEMRKALRLLNRDYEDCDPPQPLAKMRIGIYSGLATSGSLGSKERLEYTVTGDIVNAAARLEAFQKENFDPGLSYCADDCRILIGGTTFDLIGADFETVSLGEFEVHGCGKVRAYGVNRPKISSKSPDVIPSVDELVIA